MKRFEINRNTITSETIWNTHNFEIVEKIPKNFFVWNIGENMGSDEYIPLAQDLKPEDKEDYTVNTNTLKAIRLNPEEVQILRKAASVGVNNLKAAEKALKNKRRGYWSDRKRKVAENSIDIFRKITA